MAAPAAPLANGLPSIAAHPYNEAAEYEKILKIRDEVFSGSHPRLAVPTHALRVASPQDGSPSSSHAHLGAPHPFPASFSPAHAAAAPRADLEAGLPPTEDAANGVAMPPSQPASNIAEFDPVLLTKSDDLVRAETHLKRQRLEKALRDQFEHKRQDARRKPAVSEAKPDFELVSIYTRVVTDAAKPASPKDDGELHDSVDENSLYSSRAPDSTPEQGPESPSVGESEEAPADDPTRPRVSAVMGAPLPHDASLDASTNFGSFPPSHAQAANPITTAMDVDEGEDEEEEEGEYSPPEATAYPTPAAVQPQGLPDAIDPRSRPLRRYSDHDDDGRGAASPAEANMRIVRNHITSPAAPQPSRVSPLAVAKDGPLSQNARQRRPPRFGRPGSPPSPELSSMQPRKKRKLERRMEKKGRRNGGFSPDPMVKEENISPPPFHDVRPLGSTRSRPSDAKRPIVIDDDPAPEIHYVPTSERYVDTLSRPLPRPVEQLLPLSEPRPLSRTSVRLGRDAHGQDLRRVASMQSVRADGPRNYAEPYHGTPTRAAAAPYIRVGSPAVSERLRRPDDGLIEYEPAPPDMRVIRTPAPVYREELDDGETIYHYAADPMPPPPPPIERIVIDQYGRRFREIIQESPSMVPRAMSVRRSDVDAYENYRPVRASSVLVDAGTERRYVGDMAPPPSTVSRRMGDASMRGSMAPSRTAREYYEAGPSPRSASVQLIDRPQRMMFVDERSDMREPVRMSSVRPPVDRYEDGQPLDAMARSQGYRAVGRASSTFIADAVPAEHEYSLANPPRYRPMEAEPRYLDSHGREMANPDGAVDARQRAVGRY